MIELEGGFRRRWDETGASPYRDLLRVACLRELARMAHAQASQTLATRGEQALGSLRPYQERIDELRDSISLEGSIESVLTGKPPSFHSFKPRPAVLSALGTEKLERFDRKWEAVLAARADASAWLIWEALRTVGLAEVGRTNQELSEELWPRGIVLYCEPAIDESKAPAGHWRGRWIVALEPGLAEPATRGFPRECFAALTMPELS